MRDRAGRLWWTTDQAVDQLGVRRERLADWVRRSKKAGHVAAAQKSTCPGCHANRFVHVDPPVRAGTAAGYLAEQLLEAEAYTAGSTRGGRLREGT